MYHLRKNDGTFLTSLNVQSPTWGNRMYAVAFQTHKEAVLVAWHLWAIVDVQIVKLESEVAA